MNKLRVTGCRLQVIDNNRVKSRKMWKTGYSVFLFLYRGLRGLTNRRLHRLVLLTFATLYSLLSTLCLKIRGAAHLPGGSRERGLTNHGFRGLTYCGLRRLVIFAFTITYCLLPTAYLHAKYSGGQPAMFLSWGTGARSLGMGKAFVAIADDASATYWNPAAMSQMVRKELMWLHVRLWEDTDYNFLSYIHPTARYGVFGINYVSLRSLGFEKVIAEFNALGEVTNFQRNVYSFNDEQSAVTLAYGKKVLENYIPNLSAGIATKFISRQLDTSKDNHFSFDVALFLESLNSYPISLGFKLQNLFPFSSGDTDDVLPLTFRFGAGYRTLRDRLVLAFDFDKIIKANFGWHTGAEYWLLDFAAVRVGFEGQSGEIVESTAGLGLKYKNYGFDYAFALHELGLSHRFSGSWRFGVSVVAKQEEALRRLTQEGFEAYRQGDYALSIERLNKLLDIDPRNREAKKLVSKLQTIIPITAKVVEPTREAELTRHGISAYVEGDPKTATNVLRYALSLQPQNDTILKMLNRAEKELGERPTEAERVAPTAAFGYLDQKLYRALEYVYAKQYDKAVIECQEVLDLEPNNVIALERLGSALFLMNQRELARKVWTKALEIDPNNTVVREALGRLK